jgi:hypothetical protein
MNDIRSRELVLADRICWKEGTVDICNNCGQMIMWMETLHCWIHIGTGHSGCYARQTALSGLRVVIWVFATLRFDVEVDLGPDADKCSSSQALVGADAAPVLQADRYPALAIFEEKGS